MKNGNHDTRMKNCHSGFEITLGEKKEIEYNDDATIYQEIYIT